MAQCTEFLTSPFICMHTIKFIIYFKVTDYFISALILRRSFVDNFLKTNIVVRVALSTNDAPQGVQNCEIETSF